MARYVFMENPYYTKILMLGKDTLSTGRKQIGLEYKQMSSEQLVLLWCSEEM